MAALGPLVAVVSSDGRNIIQQLACGHTINNGAPLGRYAHKPAARRRCYFCAALAEMDTAS